MGKRRFAAAVLLITDDIRHATTPNTTIRRVTDWASAGTRATIHSARPLTATPWPRHSPPSARRSLTDRSLPPNRTSTGIRATVPADRPCHAPVSQPAAVTTATTTTTRAAIGWSDSAADSSVMATARPRYIAMSRPQMITSITSTSGTPIIIQVRKLGAMPIPAMYWIAIALGGLPMGVPSPPTLAENGTASRIAVR
jgi:hypothetical protein